MSGYCLECGNDLCICSELEEEAKKQPDVVFICQRKEIEKLQAELQKTREDIKNGYHEAYGLDSDLTIDELRDRVRLMHSWVKQHQYAVENYNNIKNQEIKTLKEQLVKAEEVLKMCNDGEMFISNGEYNELFKYQYKEWFQDWIEKYFTEKEKQDKKNGSSDESN